MNSSAHNCIFADDHAFVFNTFSGAITQYIAMPECSDVSQALPVVTQMTLRRVMTQPQTLFYTFAFSLQWRRF